MFCTFCSVQRYVSAAYSEPRVDLWSSLHAMPKDAR